ncbi:transcriptional regulator LysR family [Eggerthella sp. CAG:209]|nr:transcriptional regulator LysR family [Eggerthella sp. CAG:209]
MNISQLEYLVSAIHLGSYSRAAKEQFVTPQAVSKAIRTLESELGLKLIVPSGKTISPTDVGLLIAEEAEEVIYHAGKIGSIASSYRLRISDEGKMRCAIASWGEGDSLIPPFVKGLLGNSGWVESLIELPNERCLSGLRLGYIDFAVLLGTPMLEGFKRKFLYSVSPNLLVGSNNPLVSRDALSVHDLKTVKLALPFHAEEVCPYLKDLASDYGVNLHFEMLNNSRESIGNFFSDNEDAALLAISGSAWEVLIPDVVSLPFVSQEGVHFPVSAIYSDSRNENADRLCDFITSNLKNKSD